jgi:hypothetical protein
MKLSVIALDYDGTIARRGVLDPSVRAAIADARTAGIVVLLVTGRILDELRRVAGDLHFVDGVIAENGAVLHSPDSGHTSTGAPAPAAARVHGGRPRVLARRARPERAGRRRREVRQVVGRGPAVRAVDPARRSWRPFGHGTT